MVTTLHGAKRGWSARLKTFDVIHDLSPTNAASTPK